MSEFLRVTGTDILVCNQVIQVTFLLLISGFNNGSLPLDWLTTTENHPGVKVNLRLNTPPFNGTISQKKTFATQRFFET